MKRHSWKDNTCVKCGIKRKRKTQSQCMAIINHPPWEVWRHETVMAYSLDGVAWGYLRPDCSK